MKWYMRSLQITVGGVLITLYRSSECVGAFSMHIIHLMQPGVESLTGGLRPEGLIGSWVGLIGGWEGLRGSFEGPKGSSEGIGYWVSDIGYRVRGTEKKGTERFLICGITIGHHPIQGRFPKMKV